jgi:hypothetical protein
VPTAGKTMPKQTSTRKRVSSTLESMLPDRRFIVELDALMERMRRDAASISYWSDGKMEYDRWRVAEALLHHLDRVLEDLDRGRHPSRPPLTVETFREVLARADERAQEDEEKAKAQAQAPRDPSKPLWLLPLTDEKAAVFREATSLEQREFLVQRLFFGTIFIRGRKRSTRGRPPDARAVFRSQRIAAHTLFREWEGRARPGYRVKEAISDACVRYNVSRSAVWAARKKWCPQMRHLQFDPATAKEFRERLEQSEDDKNWSR